MIIDTPVAGEVSTTNDKNLNSEIETITVSDMPLDLK